MFFGNAEGERICKKAQLALDKVAQDRASANGDSRDMANEAVGLNTCDEPATKKEVEAFADAKREDGEELEAFVKRTCVWCVRENDPSLEFLVRSPGVWLHALQYTVRINGIENSFRTDTPAWCEHN
jgi:hypothetical protein